MTHYVIYLGFANLARIPCVARHQHATLLGLRYATLIAQEILCKELHTTVFETSKVLQIT